MDSPSAQGHCDSSVGATAAETADGSAARRGPAPADPAPANPATAEPTISADTGPAATERLWEDLRRLRAALELLIATRRDQVKLKLGRAFVWGIAIGLATCGAAILAGTACVMVVVGIAGGLGELLGGRMWLGQLLTGLGFVVGGGLLGIVLMRIAQRRSRRKTLERYGKVER